MWKPGGGTFVFMGALLGAFSLVALIVGSVGAGLYNSGIYSPLFIFLTQNPNKRIQ
jgi:hypothetical protein